MNKIFNRITSLLLLIAMLAFSLYLLNNLTVRKFSITKYGDFFEHSADYDILYFGTSHTEMGFLPLELWDEYGYTSYNFGNPGSSIATSYWTLVNALDYSDPKLVIFDLFFIDNPDKSNTAASLHEALDWIPLSVNKVRSVADLCKDTPHSGNELEFIFPFSIYHTRWNELTSQDFSPEMLPTNGAIIGTTVDAPAYCSNTSKKLYVSENSAGMVYLEKLIELCNSKGIKLLLTYLPYPAPYDEVCYANGLEDIAAQKGIDYINFFKTNTIDFETDMADPSSHMNIQGAKKITSYLGNYIQTNYSITDYRGDPSYSWMDVYLDEYRDYEVELFRDQLYLHNFVGLLRNKNWACLISLKQNTDIYENSTLLKSLETISISSKPAHLYDAANSGEAYVMYVNNVSGEIIEFVGDEIPESFMTDIGCVSPNIISDIQCVIYDGATGNNIVEYYFSSLGNGFFERDY